MDAVSAVEPLADSFRLAMRRLTSTVTIITTRHAGRRHGMAATAVSSLAMTPPSILVCVNGAASIHDPIGEARRYCVNLLSLDHRDLVPAFSGKLAGEERFTAGRWAEGSNEVPYLADAQAALFCRVAQATRFGTHSIFIGEVEEVRLFGETAPLLYGDGVFSRATSLEPAAAA